MERLEFNDYEEFACEVADKFDELNKEEFEDIAVIAKPNEVKEIFKELVCIGYDICNITYERIDWDGYDDEYILSMNHDGIWLEKFKNENEYLKDESTITYILDNCSSKVIPYCKGKNVYEVTVGIDEDDECGCDECDDCEECLTINGKPATKEEFDNYTSQFKHDEKPTTTTTTTTKESYFINGKSVDKSEFDKEYEKFEEKYMDNIRDMLLNYCEFMDSVNDWRNRIFSW